MPASYGHRNVSHSVTYPGTPWADLAIAYSSADDVYDDITSFLRLELSPAISSQAEGRFGRRVAADRPGTQRHKNSLRQHLQGSSSLS